MTEARPIRQSLLAKYADCPLSARLQEQGVNFNTHAQARGTIAHTFCERVIAECVESGERTYPPEMGKDLMGELIAESGLPVPPQEFDALMAMAWKFCAERSFDPEHVVDLEQTLTLEVEGVTITGRPDYLAIRDREGEVRDFKTSWAIPGEAAVAGTFQGRLYGRMVFAAFPHLSQVTVIIDPLRWGEGAAREAVITRSDLPDMDAYLGNLIRRVVKSREDDYWEASPGSWCAVCPDPRQCPIPAAERGEGGIVDTEAAKSAAAWLTATEARASAIKKALRSYVDENEPVRVGDLEFAFKLRSDSEQCIDKDALKQAMKGAGLDWDQFFKTRKGYTEFRGRKVAA
jgi:hypothetical protein